MVTGGAAPYVTSSDAAETPKTEASETAPKTAAQPAAPKTEEKKVVKYVGSSEAKKYHKPSCELAKKIKKENLVQFASAAEAKKAGYAPCKICLGQKTSTNPTTSAGVSHTTKAPTPSPKAGQ